METHNENPSYYAIIPSFVRYDNRLIPRAILLYGEITALCNKTGVCWATDDYFSKIYKVSKTTIQNWLSSLEKYGYISREVQYKEGTKHIEKRYIRIVEYLPKKTLIPIQENLGRGIQEKLNYPMQENLRENNTSINNINNNNTINIEQSPSKEADKASLKKRFDELWEQYPTGRKQGKDKAFKSYQKAIKDGVTDETILKGINDYKKQIELQRTETQFIKQGSTWFNGKHWQDEYSTTNNVSSNKPDYVVVPPEWQEMYKDVGKMPEPKEDYDLDSLPF